MNKKFKMNTPPTPVEDLSLIRRSESSLPSFLRSFYNCGAYFLISPGIYYKYDQAQSQYICKTYFGSITQKIILLLQLFITLCVLVDHLYLTPESVWNTWNEDNFKSKFNIFINIWLMMVIGSLYSTFTRMSDDLCEILNKVDKLQRDLQDIGVKPRNSNFMKALSAFVAILIPAWAGYTYLFLNLEIHTKTIKTLLKDFICQITRTELDICLQWEDDFDLKDLPLGQIVLVTLFLVGSFMSGLIIHFAECLPMVHSIVFFCVVQDFTRFLKTSNSQNAKRQKQQRLVVLKIFEEICVLSECLDNLIGFLIGLLCLDVLTYYADVINDLYSHGNTIAIHLALYGTVLGSFLVLAAESTSKLESIVFWFQNSRGEKTSCCQQFSNVSCTCDKNTDERLRLALHQLGTQQIGIRGRVFTVTYGFVWNMVSLLLTYSILIAQHTAS